MDKITPFVPITERVLDEKEEPSWRETFRGVVSTLFRRRVGHVTKGQFVELLKPGLKKMYYDEYKDFPAAPNISFPKVGNHDRFLDYPGKEWFIDD